MSNSYDITLREAVSFDVEIVKATTEKLVNFFLNQNNIKLDLVFMGNNNTILKFIKPDDCDGFFENNYDAGGYIYYQFEGTEFTDYPAYRFALCFVRLDKTSIKFIIQLSVLIAIAQLAGCTTISDAFGTFKDVDYNTDEITLENLMKLAAKDSCPLTVAIEKFYTNIYAAGRPL